MTMITDIEADQPLTEVPDLTTYRQVHAALRVSTQRLTDALDRLIPGDRRRAGALRRWFAGYGNELHAHHEIEDRIFFPALTERVPRFARFASDLDTQHECFDELIVGLGKELQLLSSASPSRGSHHSNAQELALELRDLMIAHLDLEDRQILPMFEVHFSAADYAMLDEKAMKDIGVRQAFFTVPWLMATMEPTAAAKTLQEAPAPMKVVYRLTRRRYAALVETALGTSLPDN